MEVMTVAEAQERLPALFLRVQSGETIEFSIQGRHFRLTGVSESRPTPPRLESNGLLSHLDPTRILAAYANAPGRELESKFLSPESSSSLAANAFGWFLGRPAELPFLPGLEDLQWPPESIELEGVARFPWAGGRHPCLDVLICTADAIVGIESKRYEPFRSKSAAEFAEAYRRKVWGSNMKRFEAARDLIMEGQNTYRHLDVVQLVKHAFGLRTQAHATGKAAVLVYLYAEPASWSDGRAIGQDVHAAHRAEINTFGSFVAGDEVRFAALSYSQLLDQWDTGDEGLAEHAWQVRTAFAP